MVRIASIVAAQTVMRLEEERRKAKPLERPKGLSLGPPDPFGPLRKDVTRINKALFGRR